MKDYKQSARNRRGAAGEDAAELFLNSAGFRSVVKINTGWKVIRWLNMKTRSAVIAPVKKVQGDFRAVIPLSGVSVLVEVKSRSPKLSLSWFEPHQIEALNDHFTVGGLSLVAWVIEPDVFLLEWPIPGLKKGSPLPPEIARELDVFGKWQNRNGRGGTLL